MILHREQQTTRVFLILLILSSAILILYVGLSKRVNVYTVNKPSLEMFEQLQEKYPHTLQCPCTTVSMPYSTVMNIDLKLHQMCSSEFISPAFIGQFFYFDQTKYYKNDFTRMSGIHFSNIAYLCIIFQILTQGSFDDYLQEQYVSASLNTREAFKIQIMSQAEEQEVKIREYNRRIIQQSIDLLKMLYPISATQNSFDLRVSPNGDVYIEPGGFPNCSCIVDLETCSTEAGFYSYDPLNDSAILLFSVIGTRLGCLPYYSVLMSNFACWYDLDCYEQVREFYQISTTFHEFCI